MVKFEPFECMMTHSTCYQNTSKMQIKGILWHDTGCDNDTIKRYVQPYAGDPDYDKKIAKIGKNRNGNDWNHSTRQAGVNAFVGRFADGSVGTCQVMPWDYRPWGCGSGKNGSCNDGWIQFEICEDDKTNKEYATQAYNEAVKLTAWLCEKYGINPYGTAKCGGKDVPTILCHWDSYELGLGSGHDDIYDWFPKIIGKDMSNVRKDVAELMKEQPAHDPGWVQDGDKWYYYNQNGQMVTSDWVQYKGQWYYLGPDGVMLTGWQTIDQTEYFFHADGHMAQGEWIDGLYLEMGGAQTYKYKGSWKKNSKGSWWEDTSGWYPTNRSVMINSKSYSFGSSGYVKG